MIWVYIIGYLISGLITAGLVSGWWKVTGNQYSTVELVAPVLFWPGLWIAIALMAVIMLACGICVGIVHGTRWCFVQAYIRIFKK